LHPNTSNYRIVLYIARASPVTIARKDNAHKERADNDRAHETAQDSEFMARHDTALKAHLDKLHEALASKWGKNALLRAISGAGVAPHRLQHDRLATGTHTSVASTVAVMRTR